MSLKLSPAEVAAQIAEAYCADDSHGYSQPNRYGTGYKELTLSDGTQVVVQTGDIDCSWLAITSYAYQGIDTGDASYTGNMHLLMDTGSFTRVAVADRQRGDILNSTIAGHAAVYLGGGMVAEAHHGDGYRGLSGETGDQDGTEVRVCDYYDDSWTDCYRCVVTREVPKNGWVPEGGFWYYYKDNERQTGWIYDGARAAWFNCDPEGRMRTGWHWDEESQNWYCFDENGYMRTGWYEDNDGQWYYLYPEAVSDPEAYGGGHPKGSMARGVIVADGGKSYAIKESGIMARGEALEIRADMSGEIHAK